MDETDLSFFKNKKNKNDKHDKADACKSTSGSTANDQFEKKKIFSRPTQEYEYNCDNPQAGIALIFNHKDVKGQKQRVGTEQDRDAVERTFSNYGYDVRVFNDLTFAELSEVLKKSEWALKESNDTFKAFGFYQNNFTIFCNLEIANTS